MIITTSSSLLNLVTELPEANIVETTGRKETDALTQNNRLTLGNIVKLKRLMDNANIPDDKRVLLMHPVLYYLFFESKTLIPQTLPLGVIRTFLGFNIVLSYETPRYRGESKVLCPIGTEQLNSDLLSCVAWHPNDVTQIDNHKKENIFVLREGN